MSENPGESPKTSQISGLRESLGSEQLLLDAIWSHFVASPASDWPRGKETRLAFGRKETLAALASLPVGSITTTDDRYTLTLFGVFLTSLGSSCFGLVVRFLEHCRATGSAMTLRAAEVRSALGLSEAESVTVGKLLNISGLWGGTFRSGPEWECKTPDNLDEIVQLDKVEEYVAQLALDSADRVRLRQGNQVDATLPAKAEDFWFVSDEALRHQLVVDRQELHRVHGVGAWKSTVILSGGILEGMLLDTLGRRADAAKDAYRRLRSRSPSHFDRWSLNDLVDVASDLRLLPKGAVQLSHGLREFRDLVHPGRQLREGITVSVDEAEVAVRTMKICFRELAKAQGG